jgi:dTDP-D-glucose 4,6-dehydratase
MDNSNEENSQMDNMFDFVADARDGEHTRYFSIRKSKIGASTKWKKLT